MSTTYLLSESPNPTGVARILAELVLERARVGDISLSESYREVMGANPALRRIAGRAYDAFGLAGSSNADSRPAPESLATRSPGTAPARQHGVAADLPSAPPMPAGRDITAERDRIAAAQRAYAAAVRALLAEHPDMSVGDAIRNVVSVEDYELLRPL